MVFSVCFDFHNQMIINTQSLKHNKMLNLTIKCFMFNYKYTELSTKSSSFRSKSSKE